MKYKKGHFNKNKILKNVNLKKKLKEVEKTIRNLPSLYIKKP
jgi:hypothetical protein